MTNIGDYYLNTTSGDIFQYQLVSSVPTWVKVGNLKGAQGPTGPKGDTGDTGSKGDKGDTGDTGPAGTAGTQWYSGTVDPT